MPLRAAAAATTAVAGLEVKVARIGVGRLIELADHTISAHGLFGVYDMTREALEASIGQWEYRGGDGQVHGPFTSEQISE